MPIPRSKAGPIELLLLSPWGAKMSGDDFKVWCYLRVTRRGAWCTKRQRVLIADLGIKRRSLQRALARLRGYGLLGVWCRYNAGRSGVYRVAWYSARLPRALRVAQKRKARARAASV